MCSSDLYIVHSSIVIKLCLIKILVCPFFSGKGRITFHLGIYQCYVKIPMTILLQDETQIRFGFFPCIQKYHRASVILEMVYVTGHSLVLTFKSRLMHQIDVLYSFSSYYLLGYRLALDFFQAHAC